MVCPVLDRHRPANLPCRSGRRTRIAWADDTGVRCLLPCARNRSELWLPSGCDYIERQRELHKERVNVVFEGRSPEGTGPENRHGMPKLPVGQRPVPNWPVLDLGDSPVLPLDNWRLEVGGLLRESVLGVVAGVPRAAAGRRRQRLPLRDDLEPHGQPLEGRALPHARRARRSRRLTSRTCCAPATTTCRARAFPTRPTCRSRARSKTTCCSCTRGRARRCRRNTAARAA